MQNYSRIIFTLIVVLLPILLFSNDGLNINLIGEYRTGIFAEGASEIVAFDAYTNRVFSVNAADKVVDVISLTDPTNPVLLFSIDLSPYGKAANSVAVKNGIVAVAVENVNKQAPGKLVMFWSYGSCQYINDVEVGALPDMVTFSPNGKYILVANEGEPSDDYSVDPEGSITVVNIKRGPYSPQVKTAGFSSYNDQKDDLIAQGVRIFSPNATVAQDMEPEYITVSKNNKTAWVTLQENNAIAVVDIKRGIVKDILPLGYKDRMLAENKFDASDKDGVINITNWPVYGMYQPDALDSYKYHGKTYIVTSNEGDSRDYAGFSEEVRVADLVLDPTVFPNAAQLQAPENIGRLKTTTTLGDIDNDGDYDEIYHYGARSFSIWTDDGELVYDSGSDFEDITAALLPNDFNSDDEENNSFDNRSDDKGPEPEGVVLGRIGRKVYAFIGFERVGGIIIYDVTCPHSPEYVDYINTRIYTGDPLNDTAGNVSPEGVTFVSAKESPTGNPLLIVGYEISGSVGIFEIETNCHHKDEELVINDNKKLVTSLYPNPFNPTATISYTLPTEGNVVLNVYNTIGQKVAELVRDNQTAGTHQVKFDGSQFSSGIYFYVLETENARKVQKMYLLK